MNLDQVGLENHDIQEIDNPSDDKAGFLTKLNQKVQIDEKCSRLTFSNSLKGNCLKFLSGVCLKIITKNHL